MPGSRNEIVLTLPVIFVLTGKEARDKWDQEGKEGKKEKQSRGLMNWVKWAGLPSRNQGVMSAGDAEHCTIHL